MSCHDSRLDHIGAAGDEDRMAAARKARSAAGRSVGWRWTPDVLESGGVATRRSSNRRASTSCVFPHDALRRGGSASRRGGKVG